MQELKAKLSEGNIVGNLCDLGLGNSLAMTPKSQGSKENRLVGLHQNLKLLCIREHYQESEETTHRMEENTNHIPDKDFISRICKRLLKFNNKKIKDPI